MFGSLFGVYANKTFPTSATFVDVAIGVGVYSVGILILLKVVDWIYNKILVRLIEKVNKMKNKNHTLKKKERLTNKDFRILLICTIASFLGGLGANALFTIGKGEWFLASCLGGFVSLLLGMCYYFYKTSSH